MPYILSGRRTAIIAHGALPENAGELNFLLTMTLLESEAKAAVLIATLFNTCEEYVSRKGVSYQHMNDALGALIGAGLELLRRITPGTANEREHQRAILRLVVEQFYSTIVAPYEDEKIVQNGDLPYGA